jgi:hypothetical protein
VRRLVDKEWHSDPAERVLVELIRATSPLGHASSAAQHIFNRVTSARLRRRRPSWFIGTFALGLGVSAVAAAAIGRSVIVSSPRSASVEVPLESASSSSPTLMSAPAFAASPEARHGVSLELGDTGTRVTPQALPSARLVARSIKGHRLVGGEDPAPLLEAIRTLRSDGDAARAGELLGAYLKAYPNSPLSEDVSALSIEAAVARHDPRFASELARQYLAAFPTGRYRAFASRAARSGNP